MSTNKIITNRKEYLKHFSNISPNTKSVQNIIDTKQTEALKYALDIRKFEIELYWKRATYFWAFIAATFAGYFALITKEGKTDNKSILIVCILGFLFSFSWYFVNRGSKFWQNNWERHVDYLEDEIIGPLYKTVKNPADCNFFNPVKEYPFSVSKINQLLSLMITAIWPILAYSEILALSPNLKIWQIILCECVFVIIITLIYFLLGKSNLPRRKMDKGKCAFVIRELE
jgi:hypothetical protein